MKISGGQSDEDIIVGNTYDKYQTNNIIAKMLVKGFVDTVDKLIGAIKPQSIHEVGCGEGFWCIRLIKKGYNVKGSDFSPSVISIAQENASSAGIKDDLFEVTSIYELSQEHDKSALIICLEVLEHLEHPELALDVLSKVATQDLILSVPSEPLWRILNICRGKYLFDLGNTPGHINHWSPNLFLKLVGQYFDIISVHKPLPWTIVHCRIKNLEG